MVKISWKQTEVNEFSEEDKAKLMDEMKHKSISEEHAVAKEAAKRIKHDLAGAIVDLGGLVYSALGDVLKGRNTKRGHPQDEYA